MTDVDRDALSLEDDDRLPWLEAVEDEDDDRVSTGKLAGFVLAALIALGIVIGGVWWLRQDQPGLKGDGTLIAAASEPYKVRPDAPGGMKVEGQGDSAFAASEGAEANGQIDLTATAEAPIAASKVATARAGAAPAAKIATAAMPVSGGKLVASPPARPVRGAQGAASGGTMVQLGAYNSEAVANEAWVRMTKRFAYLAPLAKSVETAAIGGSTFYRLRADAGAEASTICGKLKVAGENCLVVN